MVGADPRAVGDASRLWARALGAAVAGLLLTYLVGVLTVPGQWLDDEIFGLVQRMAIGPLRGLKPLARAVLPAAMLVALALVAAWGLARRHLRRAGAALVVPLLSIPVARLLRVSLPRPDHGYSYVDNTLPSTHAVVVVAAAAAILMILPRTRPRWVVVWLGLVVLVACLGNVVGHAHRPSDVVASVLLVLAVASAVQLLSDWLSGRLHG